MVGANLTWPASTAPSEKSASRRRATGDHELLALFEHRYPGQVEPLEDPPGPRLITGDSRPIELFDEPGPVPAPTGVGDRPGRSAADRRSSRRPPTVRRYSATDLHRLQDSASYPAIGGLVVHPERPCGALEVHRPCHLVGRNRSRLVSRCRAPDRARAALQQPPAVSSRTVVPQTLAAFSPSAALSEFAMFGRVSCRGEGSRGDFSPILVFYGCRFSPDKYF